MSRSSLPPELLRQIIESTVPHSFHTDTYEERQDNLRTLSLVSRQFRAIAQPLLVEIVWVQAPRTDQTAQRLHDLLDLIAWAGWNRVPRHFTVRLYYEGPGVMSAARLPEIIPSLQSLTLGNKGEVVHLAFLNRFDNLTNLQLANSDFKIPTPLVLPHVRSLALTCTSHKMVADLLSPEVFPSLRSLGIDFDEAFEEFLLPNPRLLSLFSQVESLCLPLKTWEEEFAHETRLTFTSRTLLDCYILQLSVATVQRFEVTNLCVQGLVDLTTDGDDLVGSISESIKRFTRALGKQEAIRLKVLYFGDDPRGEPKLSEEAEELINDMLDECQKKGIEVVFTELQSVLDLDPYILVDFEERQRSLAQQGGSK
ncbi:uncharacterized protein JCM6883_007393 [Sporobolomyces salmoneus]|uniref:uncharacterized protein n=1 Tax=Sporobolomyces salmoneus TaxID=183962 RepID=UPI003179D6D0